MSKSGGNVGIVTAALVAVAVLILVFQLVLQAQEEIFSAGEIRTEIPEGVDLAVVGGTTAALLVAQEAAEHGASVFIFPHGQELGGDCRFLVEEGLAAIGTPPQREMGLQLTAAEFKNLIRQRGGDINKPLLLEYFGDDAEQFYSRAEKRSEILFDTLPLADRNPYLHFSSFLDPAATFKGKMLADLERSGVIFRSETIQEINFSPQGRVESLSLEGDEGKGSLLFLQGLILADGGYSADISRWHEFFPQGDNYIQPRPSQENYGLQLAADQGANIIQTGFFNKRIILYPPQHDEHFSLPEWSLEEALLVNSAGEILNGNQFEADRLFSFVLNSPADEVYVIMSEEMALDVAEPDFFRIYEELEEVTEAYSLAEPGNMQEMGLPAPPYYIAPVKCGVDYTLGGVAVTPSGEVLKGERIIPGLYAAGEIAGGLHGEAMLPGMALSETLYFSRAAGRAAAEYATR